MTTPNIYTYDWFSNRDENAVIANSSLSLGLDIDTDFSKFLYTPAQVNDFCSNTTKFTMELIKTAKVVCENKNVSVLIKKDGTESYTDGKNIVISHEPIKTNPNYKGIDLSLGLLLHELCHCRFTNFGYIVGAKNRINPLIHHIHNIIEDEVIEEMLGTIHPGYSKFIAKVKNFVVETGAQVEDIDNDPNELNVIMGMLWYAIRFPKELSKFSQKNLEKFAEPMEKIYQILKDGKVFEINVAEGPTQRNLDAAFKIYDVIRTYIVDEENNSNEKFLQMIADSATNSPVLTLEIGSSESESSNPNEYDKTMMNVVKEALDEMNNEKENKGSWNGFGGESSSIGARTPQSGDRKLYVQIVSETRDLIQYVRSMVVCNSTKDVLNINRFRRNGQLDTSKLAEAMQNINTVYNQRNFKKVQKSGAKYTFVLMLDESGSMNRNHTHRFASKLATIFTEALYGYDEIDFRVYGHGDNVIKYIGGNASDKSVVCNRQLQFNQNESISYKTIIEDVRSTTSLPIVAVNITDSKYLSTPAAISQVFNQFDRITFGLISLDDTADDRIKAANDEIYGPDNWMISNNRSPIGVKEIVTKIANIIKINYDKNK